MRELEPVKIVSLNKVLNKYKLVFHKEVFDKIINQLNSSLRVAIVTINGAYRSGKSFILNFIANELYKNTNFIIRHDTYKWIHGRNSGTVGMWMLNCPVILEIDGHATAVILIDTQGIFDTQLDIESTTALFGLSTLISSYQIYNLDKRIQEDNLQYLALFSEFATVVTKVLKGTTNLKPFQHINLLVRDWQNFTEIDNNIKRSNDAKNYLEDVFSMNGKTNDLIDTRDHILKCYSNISCTLLPHPGYNVSEGMYNGISDDIRNIFLVCVNQYSKDIKESIECKKIMGRTILINEISTYIAKYVDMLQDDDIPKPKTILSTTIDILYLNLIFNSLQYYQDRMNVVLKSSNYMDINELNILHDQCKINTIEYFDSKAIMGTELHIGVARDTLNGKIDKNHKDYIMLNESKKGIMNKYVWIFASFIITWVIQHLLSLVCTSELCNSLYFYLTFIYYMYIIYFFMRVLNYFNIDIETVKLLTNKLMDKMKNN